jgi:hypothetical protein
MAVRHEAAKMTALSLLIALSVSTSEVSPVEILIPAAVALLVLGTIAVFEDRDDKRREVERERLRERLRERDCLASYRVPPEHCPTCGRLPPP